MSFRFSTDADSDTYKTLGSLVKYNNGFFKSAKQARFVLSEKFSWAWSRPSQLKNDEMRAERVRSCDSCFGFSFDPVNETVVTVSAMTTWAGYGVRSIRRVEWMFVIDKYGVVAQYKLGFNYSTDGRSSSVEPSKTTLVWGRDADAVLPTDLYAEEERILAETKATNANKSFVGRVGERREFTAKIVSVKEFQGKSFSYYDSGIRTMTVLEDADGNKLMYWNSMGTKGETVRFKATVKSHDEYKGVKQTTISRAKVLESLGGGEDQTKEEPDLVAA